MVRQLGVEAISVGLGPVVTHLNGLYVALLKDLLDNLILILGAKFVLQLAVARGV